MSRRPQTARPTRPHARTLVPGVTICLDCDHRLCLLERAALEAPCHACGAPIGADQSYVWVDGAGEDLGAPVHDRCLAAAEPVAPRRVHHPWDMRLGRPGALPGHGVRRPRAAWSEKAEMDGDVVLVGQEASDAPAIPFNLDEE